jgi:hypothetical protein
MRIALFGSAALSFAAVFFSARAHHAVVNVDTRSIYETMATVVEWRFGAPHVWMLVRTDAGEELDLLAQYPTVLEIRGWDSKTFEAGDRVRIGFHRHTDEAQAGRGLLLWVQRDGSHEILGVWRDQ